LTPTELGLNITKILIEIFPQFMDIHFTAETEKVLDEIAEGKKKKLPVLTEYWKLLQTYLDNSALITVSKPESIELGEYKDGKIVIVTTRYGDAIKYEPKNKKNKDVMYVNISSKEIDLPQAILLLENKGKQNESGELIGEEGKYKYVKSKAKFGEVIKRVSGNDVEYRNINKYKKEVDLKLAKLLFSYPKTISKTISLNYNLLKDSYYLRENKKYVNVPLDKVNLSKEELVEYWNSNKK
jgi:hypothetical protein